MSPAFAGSLRLDVGGLDHFGPLLGFGSNVLAEISGWATERCGAEVGKPPASWDRTGPR